MSIPKTHTHTHRAKYFLVLRICLVAFLASVTFSCIQEPESPSLTLENPDLLTARSWYESNITESTIPENARQFGGPKGKPDWSKSKIYHQADGKKVIEVKFDWEQILIPEYLDTENLDKASVLQTLLLFPKKEGKHVPYILTIYPDNPDRKFSLNDFMEGGYQKIPTDFSGRYHFSKPNGKFVGGWLIKEGVRTSRIRRMNTKKDKGNSGKSDRLDSRCYVEEIVWKSTACSVDGVCHTTITDVEFVGVTCDPDVSVPIRGGDTSSGSGGSAGPPSDSSEECEVPEGNLLELTVGCEELTVDDFIDYLASRFGRKPNECEKEILRSDPINWPKAVLVFVNAEIAESKTIELFGINGWRDCADAFRHAYWNALNIQEISINDATLFANAHECESSIENMDVQMDLFNNRVGRGIGLNYSFSYATPLWGKVLESLNSGNLKIISNLTSQGYYTLSSKLVDSSSCQQ